MVKKTKQKLDFSKKNNILNLRFENTAEQFKPPHVSKTPPQVSFPKFRNQTRQTWTTGKFTITITK